MAEEIYGGYIYRSFGLADSEGRSDVEVVIWESWKCIELESKGVWLDLAPLLPSPQTQSLSYSSSDIKYPPDPNHLTTLTLKLPNPPNH